MRKLVVILLVALAVPAAAFARQKDRGDGTLAVKGASGTIEIKARGSILGRLDSGSLTITDWNPNDASDPQVIGADRMVNKTDLTTVYRGKGIRFRFVSGRYTIRIVGTGVDLAAVGSGTVRLTGAGTLDDGVYALDGAPFKALPLLPTPGSFGTPLVTSAPVPVGG